MIEHGSFSGKPKKPKIPIEESKDIILKARFPSLEAEKVESHRLSISDKYQRLISMSEYLRRSVVFFRMYGEYADVMSVPGNMELFDLMCKRLPRR